MRNSKLALSGLIVFSFFLLFSKQINAQCIQSTCTGDKAEFFNNSDLAGSPVIISGEYYLLPLDSYIPGLLINVVSRPEECGVDSDVFSARWSISSLLYTFDNWQRYRFTMTCNGGCRLYMFGNLVLDKWTNKGLATSTYDVSIFSEPYHDPWKDTPVDIIMEYRNEDGSPRATLSYEHLPDTVPSECFSGESTGTWDGEYFNNKNLSGAPVMTQKDLKLDFQWDMGSPAPQCGIPEGNFSARWKSYMMPPDYGNRWIRFNVYSIGGFRLYFNGALVLDRWFSHGPSTDYVDIQMAMSWHCGPGTAPVIVEYFSDAKPAAINVSWEEIPEPNCFEDPPNDHWRGEYFSNTNLSGSPLMVRDDGTGFINFNWGMGGPSNGCNLGADNFSVRWTRTVNIASSGYYRFNMAADDGMRVYIDGALMLDKWIVQSATPYTFDTYLTAGDHIIKAEYFEKNWGASAQLSWQGISAPVAINLLKDPDFDCLKKGCGSYWSFYTNGQGSFTEDLVSGTDYAAHVKLTTVGNNMQLSQFNISLKPNKRYHLSFYGASKWGHDVLVSLLKNVSPYTNYGVNSVVDLPAGGAAGMLQKQIVFTTKGFSAPVNDGRLMFYFPGYATAGDEYWIDKIVLDEY